MLSAGHLTSAKDENLKHLVSSDVGVGNLVSGVNDAKPSSQSRTRKNDFQGGEMLKAYMVARLFFFFRVTF